MIPTCPTDGELVEREIDRVLTQYRESPKLLHVLRTNLRQIETVIQSICDMPSKFELMTAVGDQLTIVGKRLGFPRCHCVCVTPPVFGFACDDGDVPGAFPIVGFCDGGSWLNCNDFGRGDICIDDDDVYRGFLSARRYQMLGLFDGASLTDALRSIWGQTAMVLDAGNGRVVMAPGRELTVNERALLPIVPRVLPVPLGIRQRFHFGELNVFGFGTGWGGFCEEWEPDGLPLLTEDGIPILVTDDDTAETELYLMTGPLTRDAPWMCEIDVKPYECAG